MHIPLHPPLTYPFSPTSTPVLPPYTLPPPPTHPKPEGDLQRVALRSVKSLTAIEQRRAHLMQHRECQLHLRLHARRTHDAHVRGRPNRIIEQRRLPNSCLTLHHQHTAAPSPRSLTQPIEDRAFLAPTEQRQPPGSRPTTSHQNGHPKGISRNCPSSSLAWMTGAHRTPAPASVARRAPRSPGPRTQMHGRHGASKKPIPQCIAVWGGY